jgi:hypothetical protein
LDQAHLIRASVEFVWDAITVKVWSVKVDVSGVVTNVWIPRVEVLGVAHTVKIGVGAAITAERAPLVGTGIIAIGYRIAVKIRATVELHQAPLLRASVILVEDPVAIQILCHRTSVMLPQAWLSRARVVHVGHPIPVAIGAATGSHWAWLTGAGIGLVEEPVAIPVPLPGRRAPVSVGEAGFIGAGIRGVRDTVRVGVGAALRGFRSWLIGTRIRYIGHAIPVSVRRVHDLDVDRTLRARPFRVEGPHDQSLSS